MPSPAATVYGPAAGGAGSAVGHLGLRFGDAEVVKTVAVDVAKGVEAGTALGGEAAGPDDDLKPTRVENAGVRDWVEQDVEQRWLAVRERPLKRGLIRTPARSSGERSGLKHRARRGNFEFTDMSATLTTDWGTSETRQSAREPSSGRSSWAAIGSRTGTGRTARCMATSRVTAAGRSRERRPIPCSGERHDLGLGRGHILCGR